MRVKPRCSLSIDDDEDEGGKKGGKKDKPKEKDPELDLQPHSDVSSRYHFDTKPVETKVGGGGMCGQATAPIDCCITTVRLPSPLSPSLRTARNARPTRCRWTRPT